MLGRKLENDGLQIWKSFTHTLIKPHWRQVGVGVWGWSTNLINSKTKQQKNRKVWKNTNLKRGNGLFDSLLVTNNAQDLLPNKASIGSHRPGIYSKMELMKIVSHRPPPKKCVLPRNSLRKYCQVG